MRKLYKGQTPSFLKEIVQEKNYKFSNNSQSRKDWRNIVSKFRKQLHEVLSVETNNMCAYCETSLVGGSNIEHILPKSQFPELMFEWENLTMICQQCNSRKTDRTLPINPFTDNPHDHFSYDQTGRIFPETASGAEVIDILSLNRLPLIESRLKTIELITILITKNQKSSINKKNIANYWGCIEYLFYINFAVATEPKLVKSINESNFKVVSNNKFYKNKFTNWLDFDLDQHSNENIKKYRQKKILIENIHIKNFKSVKDITIKFGNLLNETVPSIILIGENGTGKSSILQAIVLGLLTQKSLDNNKRLKLKNEYLRIDNGNNFTQEGSIEIKLTDIENPTKLTFNTQNTELLTSGRKMPVLAYGSTRLLSKTTLINEITNGLNIENLFNSRHELIDAEAWLLSLSDKEFKYVSDLVLREILMLKENETISRSHNKILIKPANIQLNSWSDGYKSVLSLVCDILYNMQSLWKQEVREINDYSGVVIIDEIEQHLHPSWKQEIIPRLKTVFPQIQFIISTHDPLCIQNTLKNEVFIVSKNETNETMLEQADVPSGIYIDKLLTGKWFSLQTTLDKETIIELKDYQKSVLSGSNKKEILDRQTILNNKLGVYADNTFWGIYRELIRETEMKEKVFFDDEEKIEIKLKIKDILNKKK